MNSVFSKAFTLQNSIIAKYVVRQVVLLLLAVSIIIGLIIFGNQLVLVVKESIEEGIPIADLLPLVSFNVIRDVPLILSLSLFLAIILAISKFYKDSEAIVMNSLGIGDKHLMVFIQPLVMAMFVFILALTTIIVPWSKNQHNVIMERSNNASEFSLIKEGKFQQFKNSALVFYAAKVNNVKNSAKQNMAQVFIYTESNGEPTITLANQAQKYTNASNQGVYLRLKDGVRYDNFSSDQNKKILKFNQYDLQIIDGSKPNKVDRVTKLESKPTWDILFSHDNKEIAEWQWRFAQPISVLILSIFGILLGKASPRGGKNLGVLVGVLLFIVYNNTLLVAKSSLERGELSPMVGLWSVHLLILTLLVVFYAYRHGKFNRQIGKAF